MLDRIVRIASRIGAGALILMVGVTFIDVIATKLLHRPLAGSYEYVALAQLVAVGLAGAETFLAGRHVQVEMFVVKLPRGARRGVIALVALLGSALFAVLAWEGFLYGRSLQAAGEVTGTVKIPLYPFGYVLGASGVLLLLVVGRELVRSLRED